MSILQRALDTARRVAAPIQAGIRDARQGMATPGGVLGQGGLIDPQRAIASVQTFLGDVGQGVRTPGGLLGLPGRDSIVGVKGVDMATPVHAAPILTPGAVAPRDVGVPAPSQPTTVTPQAGAFQAQAPATRAPIVTPATAPTPAMTPPAPFMMGGGGDRGAIIGGGINVPTETPLPPARVLPADLGTEAPMGQFDAMIRALQAGQEFPSRYVPMPAAGATPFGPAGAQERALRRLRERELM